MQRDREEKLFCRSLGNARERADFGVGKLAAFHGHGDPRQGIQRTRDSNLLTRGPTSMPHFQLSQWAQDCVAESAQPLRRSNSAMSVSRR